MPRNVRDYAVVTAAYWAFTLTDGALRMLVLLYLNDLGYSPLAIASLFLFYEFFGIVTNFVGGWLGARVGLKATLFGGLALQVAACGMLGARAGALTVPFVMFAQSLSGVAKDLTKMSSKSYIRLVVPSGDERGLMRWVALLTGSKNTLKGAGFFLGGLLLAAVGFRAATYGMAGMLVIVLCVAVVMLPGAPGRAPGKTRFGAMFSKDARLNWLSAARFFLFGARDIWFVLALPIFLADELGWSHSGVGAFLACWVIGYGIVQAGAPAYTRATDARSLVWWTGALLVPLGALLALALADAELAVALPVGLGVFGVIFAGNSAIHSYLVVAYAEEDRVSMAVGFYYTANAAGRLVGTLLSGALYQGAGLGKHGLATCLAGSIVFVAASLALWPPLRRAERRRGSAAAPQAP